MFRPASGWLLAASLPLVALAVVRGLPQLDARWENHPAHFWLVAAVAAAATVLGYSVSVAARHRRDARLFLVSVAFIISSGFLGMHALATPGVLLGPNAGFELATPIGLLLSGAVLAVSGVELPVGAARRLMARSRSLLGAVAVVMVAWGVVSLGQMPPLDGPLGAEELNGWQSGLAALGVTFYAAGAVGYLRLHRRRGARLVWAVMAASVLLAEAMVVIAFARNWLVSWWEWHALMFGAFALISLAARQEWHEERFGALYLDDTWAGERDASILFADLEGYTTYAEAHEPAVVTAMLNAYFSRLVPLLKDLGGEVHQIVGDALMVVFNKQGDQPDHALLAARAALALQSEAAAIAAQHPEWPRFRVGVNSGTVMAGVVGDRGHRKHALVGDAVNLAARLQSEAPAGGVLVGPGTFHRLPAGTEAEELPPLRLKGKQEHTIAYLLKAMVQGPGRPA